MQNNQEVVRLSTEIEDILEVFYLERNIDCEMLKEWLSASFELNTQEQEMLEELRQNLREEGDFWNEEELKMNFLAFLFYLSKLNEKNKFKLFFERPLQTIINGYELKVVCDALIAKPKGIGKPQKPFFFLQEFKKQKNALDAEAQMLTAMLIAQEENKNSKPIYGCWIQGKYWVFAMLKNKNYCVSSSFDATKKEDLHQIMYALKELKNLILKQINT